MSQFELDEQFTLPEVALSEIVLEPEQQHQLILGYEHVNSIVGKIATQVVDPIEIDTPHLLLISSQADKSPDEAVHDLDRMFPALSLNNWQKDLLIAISNTEGLPFRPSDIYTQIGTLKPNTKRLYFNQFSKKFRESPYAEMLSVTGMTVSRRYTWLGEALSSNTIDSQKMPRQTQDISPTRKRTLKNKKAAHSEEDNLNRRRFDDEVTVLSFVGIDMQLKENKKTLSIQGKPLNISELSIEVLTELASHEGRMTLGRLVRSKRLQAMGIGAESMSELHEALDQIEETMEAHGITWRKNTLYTEDKTITTLILGDLEEIRLKMEIAEQTDYLRFMGVSLPKGVKYVKANQRTIGLMLTSPDAIVERLADGEDYEQFGLCNIVESETFWPQETNIEASEPAISVCKVCKVGTFCLNDALDNKIDRGVWGGLSERQRRAYLRKQSGSKIL